MGVFDAEEERVVGGTGLHPRGGEGSLEIGYWVRADSVRQGITTEVTAVLTRVGFEHLGLDRVDIQIDPENVASQGVPRKLGFVHEGTLRRRLARAEGQPRADSMVFTMLRDEYAATPWREAYAYEEAIGARVCADVRRRGVILRPLGPVVVMMPPLSITDAQIQKLVAATYSAIVEVCGA